MLEWSQVLDNGRRLHLADAADATRQAFSGVAKGISSAFMLPIQSLQNAFKLAPPALPDSAERQPVRIERQPVRIERQPVRIERQPKGTSMEAGPLPAGATVTISVRTSENGSLEASPVEGRMTGEMSCILFTLIQMSFVHAQLSKSSTHNFTASNPNTSRCQHNTV